MPTLQFKGKNIIWNHHLSIPYHTLEEVSAWCPRPVYLMRCDMAIRSAFSASHRSSLSCDIWDLNADIYRALAIAYEISGDTKGLISIFDAWKSEHPDDPDAQTEWMRVSRKYLLDN
jgi:hypothetical protein